MSAWSDIEFEFETESGEKIMIGLSTYATGNYEEPQLEPDGEVMIKRLTSDAWLSLDEAGLSPADRSRLANEIDRELDLTLANYGDDIGQSLAESAADALYESWKDRDHD